MSKAREEKGMSLRKLALQAGMDYSQLSKIERGVIHTTVCSLQALAEALNIPLKNSLILTSNNFSFHFQWFLFVDAGETVSKEFQ